MNASSLLLAHTEPRKIPVVLAPCALVLQEDTESKEPDGKLQATLKGGGDTWSVKEQPTLNYGQTVLESAAVPSNGHSSFGLKISKRKYHGFYLGVFYTQSLAESDNVVTLN